MTVRNWHLKVVSQPSAEGMASWPQRGQPGQPFKLGPGSPRECSSLPAGTAAFVGCARWPWLVLNCLGQNWSILLLSRWAISDNSEYTAHCTSSDENTAPSLPKRKTAARGIAMHDGCPPLPNREPGDKYRAGSGSSGRCYHSLSAEVFLCTLSVRAGEGKAFEQA